jgi:pimeloyl-ACP methyl ester carboxylesterase
MLRLSRRGLLLAAASAPLPEAAPFVPSPRFRLAGPTAARGALVWLHEAYDTNAMPNGPPEAPWVARLARDGYDIWRFDRTAGRDPLGPGAEALLRGLASLRAAHYRRVVVAGHSRGAFIALAALARPDLADAVAAVEPAAHGTSPDRWRQALEDFADRIRAERGVPLALVQLRDDPYEPDPGARAAMARAAGMPLLLIDRPAGPTGHMGAFGADFDARFGACLAHFLEKPRRGAACR